MVDVIQVPVYTESTLIYIVLSALIFGFVALAIFILMFFRKDYKEMILKTAKVEAKMKGLDKSLAGAETIDARFKNIEKHVEKGMRQVEGHERELESYEKQLGSKADAVDRKLNFIDLRAKHYAKNLDKHVNHDMNSIRRFVISKVKDEHKDVVSSVKEDTDKNADEITRLKSEINKIQKDVKKRYKDLALFFLFRIFEDLTSETSENRIEKKLEDLRLFIKFSKKNNHWSKSLEETTAKFLRDMEKRWKSKSKDISTLYSISLDGLRNKDF